MAKKSKEETLREYEEIKKIILSQPEYVRNIICFCLGCYSHKDSYIKKTIDAWKILPNPKRLVEELIEAIVEFIQDLSDLDENEIDKLHFAIKRKKLDRLEGTVKSCVRSNILQMTSALREPRSIATSIVDEFGLVDGIRFVCAVLKKGRKASKW